MVSFERIAYAQKCRNNNSPNNLFGQSVASDPWLTEAVHHIDAKILQKIDLVTDMQRCMRQD